MCVSDLVYSVWIVNPISEHDMGRVSETAVGTDCNEFQLVISVVVSSVVYHFIFYLLA